MPVAGPMDAYSLRAANLLVGNGDGCRGTRGDAARSGAPVRFCFDCCSERCAVFDDARWRGFPFHTAVKVNAGSTLRFGERTRGARAYLAVSGGILVPLVMGSRATHLPSVTGGLNGRALKAGDVLLIGEIGPANSVRAQPLPLPVGEARARVLPGPHIGHFGADALDRLASIAFRVSPQSNRLGYRLEGARVEPAGRHTELISVSMPLGGLQVPRSGEPILLMADHGTTGGYPVIAVVITADLPIAGQLAPGDTLRFVPCTMEEALTALRDQEARLLGRAR